ncbi:MAG: glycosyltransferase [Roseburia sp.]
MKKIVLTIGGVETLEYFSREMGKELEKMGYAIFYFDLKNAKESAKKVRKFIKTGETALVTFNFQGLEKEEEIYREREGYLWEEFHMPCFNIAADHPYFYHDRLKELPTKYYHISIDRMQQKYFETFYPEFESLGFLPLAGTELENSCSLASVGTEFGKSEEKRTIDVIMTGNYTELPFFEPYIHWINDEYAAFYQGIIDDLLVRTGCTVEEVALEHCEREMGENTTEDLRIALSKMIFIDMYVRNYWRGKAVATLVDAGIKVDVVGKGWDKLPVEHPENLIFHPQTDSLTCLQLLQQTKISLNVMPWFKDGAHDRVFNSILNGAVCVSDTSRYLCEELEEGDGICYYELSQMEKLPELVERLLAHEEKLPELVSRGQEIVRKKHTWAVRARKVAEWLEQKN